MARPAAKELTERELEVMHTFWKHGEQTAHDARTVSYTHLTLPTREMTHRCFHSLAGAQ